MHLCPAAHHGVPQASLSCLGSPALTRLRLCGRGQSSWWPPSPLTSTGRSSQPQIRQGWLAALVARHAHACKKFADHPQEVCTDNYFYESASNVSLFLEEKAYNEQGELRQAKELCINKLGHGA